MARLEDYELGRVLARGGMGVVHEAVERATGRRVALKRILPGALDRDAISRFVLEGRAVARLTHPGIVRVHALEEAPGGGPFMVMDLVAGESLQRVIDRGGPLAPARALELARELARALAHAHGQGVLHRDLKPANVLVDETGAARLIDFGLAKVLVGAGSLAHLTRTGEVIGTPTFMSPEQANGGATDARTDVYGLGATLFALLTGKPPFSGASALAVMYAVLSEVPPPPSRLRKGLSPALDALVLACLEKDPADRPASMAALLARLDGLEPEGAGSPTWRALIAGAVVATALLVASLVAAYVGQATAPIDPPASLPPVVTEQAVERPDDPAWWLERARALARAGKIEEALAPPAPGAPAAAWLAHGRALLAAGRATDAAAALANRALDGAAREVVLARFQAEVAREPKTADPRALERELGRDPAWADGVFERELHLLKTTPDRARLRVTVKALVALGAEELAVRLRGVDVLENNKADEITSLLSELDARKDLEARSDPAAALLLVERADLRRRYASEDRAERLKSESDLTRALELDPLLSWAHEGRARSPLDAPVSARCGGHAPPGRAPRPDRRRHRRRARGRLVSPRTRRRRARARHPRGGAGSRGERARRAPPGRRARAPRPPGRSDRGLRGGPAAPPAGGPGRVRRRRHGPRQARRPAAPVGDALPRVPPR